MLCASLWVMRMTDRRFMRSQRAAGAKARGHNRTDQRTIIAPSSMDQTPTVVVAGGAGYIGSHMVRMLRDNGLRPVIVDNLATGHREAAGSEILKGGDVG